jgi:hypothetical protein
LPPLQDILPKNAIAGGPVWFVPPRRKIFRSEPVPKRIAAPEHEKRPLSFPFRARTEKKPELESETTFGFSGTRHLRLAKAPIFRDAFKFSYMV